MQTFAYERFASKMPVERMERKAERFGRELVLCHVTKYVQICNYSLLMKDKCSGKTTDAASASMTVHDLRNS